MTDPPDGRCPCGGQWVDGRIAVPIVGALRFVYRLGTNEVATEVAAQMCGNCGAVQLRARDPEAIVRAHRAAAHGRRRFRTGQEG
jgi:protein involved in polysaccharide export with SLBB domain